MKAMQETPFHERRATQTYGVSYNTCYGVNYVDNLHGPKLGETSLADPMQHDDCIPA